MCAMKYRISGLVLLETFSEMSLRIGVQFMGEECIDLANLKILPFLVQTETSILTNIFTAIGLITKY